MIDNDISVAVAEWQFLPQQRREAMRFVWGHRFASFQKRAGLTQPVRIVGLLRHPLLKVSGVDVRSVDALPALDGLSVQTEFEDYAAQGGPLPFTSVADFIAGHFVVGITELMEESLFVLRAKLGVTAPMTPWERIGAHANPHDNIYAHGLMKDFVERAQYAREIGYYEMARARLVREMDALGLWSAPEFVAYKAACRERDVTLAKWSSAYPHVFETGRSTRPPEAGWRRRFGLVRRPAPEAPTRILPGREGWTVVMGSAGAALTARPDDAQPLWELRSPRFVLKLETPVTSRSTPNMIRLELDFPAVQHQHRWLYCSLDRRMLFQVEVGQSVGVRRFDVPVSPSVGEIDVIINQFADLGESGRWYARVLTISVLRIPLQAKGVDGGAG